MTIGQLKSRLSSLISISDSSILLELINMAATEVWATSDFPDQLRIEHFTITDEKQVTLPHYVGQIRKIRFGGGLVGKVTTISDMFNDYAWTQDTLTWRVIGTTPLKSRISNATKLTVTCKAAPSENLNIFLSGPTDIGASVSETLQIIAGSTSATSVNRFTDLTGFAKNCITNFDIVLSDASGREIGYLPNNFYEARHLIVQVNDPYAGVTRFDTSIIVLFKPTLGILSADSDFLEDSFAIVVLWKAAEIYKMTSKDELDHAAALQERAIGLYQMLGKNIGRGRDLRMSFSQNPFTNSEGFGGL